MTRARNIMMFVAVLAMAGVAQASWYDDYDAGIAAVKKGSWSTVVQKMTAAIRGNGSENNKARTYATIFINYHPYYYRGVAYLNLGEYEKAIADLEQAQGPGEVDLGPISFHLERAKTKLAAATPEPEPARPEPARPAPVVQQPAPQPAIQQPAVPSVDPALRQRATSAIASTKQKLQAAQQRRATTSQQYSQAMSMFTEATTRSASARSNDDYSAIISMAENAGVLADLATAPSAATQTSPAIPAPALKPSAATNEVLGEYRPLLRRALENYFAGEFEAATRDFQKLTQQLPGNAWIWAFLGASQYSQYAFEADESYRAAALKSFRKAKQLRVWKDGLPSKYFSRRIRNAFRDTAG
ncbi:MAG TPA: tetratricopeptide repeat protein [Thermoanaerobaculia bacterium]|jgi:tetratricopeptide (TPR) repeat protein